MPLTVVTVSPRMPPGLLSLPAWEALRAGPVGVGQDGPVVEAVRAAGIAVAVGDSTQWLATPAAERAVWLASVDDRLDGLPPHRVVPGSWDPPGARLLDVVTVMDRLWRECPWDGQQTHESLKPYLLEEAYEVYDALTDGDLDAVREELGDLLFQIVFHAQLAAASPGWTVDDVAADLVAKLIRRHPHVFAGREVSGADEVNANWDVIKRAEKQRESVFDGVPSTLPALVLAATLARKARRAGVPDDLLPASQDGPGAAGSPAGPPPERSGLGAGLFAAAAERADAEDALRQVARRFRAAVTAAERAARADGRDPSALAPQEWRRYWPAG